MSAVLKRNADAVAETLADMDRRLRDQQREVDGLRGQVVALLERVTSAEQGLVLARARIMGTGPTVR